jgi:hypothetical protein
MSIFAEGNDELLEQQALLAFARQNTRKVVGGSEGSNQPQLASLKQLWTRLVRSALARNVSEKYLTAACNAISVFLKAYASSSDERIRHFIESSAVWADAFGCAQYAFASGRSKPAIQVLETLVHLLNEHSDQQLAIEILSRSARTMLDTIITNEPVGKMKPSCVTLSCLLRKSKLPVDLERLLQDCLQQHGISWQTRRAAHKMLRRPRIEASNGLEDLFLALLFAINNLETRSSALKLFNLLCEGQRSDPGSTVAEAARVLSLYVQEHADTLADFANNVLPALLDSEHSWKLFEALYNPSSTSLDRSIELYLAILKVGRLKEYVKETGKSNLSTDA